MYKYTSDNITFLNNYSQSRTFFKIIRIRQNKAGYNRLYKRTQYQQVLLLFIILRMLHSMQSFSAPTSSSPTHGLSTT